MSDRQKRRPKLRFYCVGASHTTMDSSNRERERYSSQDRRSTLHYAVGKRFERRKKTRVTMTAVEARSDCQILLGTKHRERHRGRRKRGARLHLLPSGTADVSSELLYNQQCLDGIDRRRKGILYCMCTMQISANDGPAEGRHEKKNRCLRSWNSSCYGVAP